VRVLAEDLADDPTSIREFHELLGRGFSRLHHPWIADVYDFAESGDGSPPFVVMEHLPGETLAQRLHREPAIEPVEALRVAVKLAEALQAAHEVGLAHGGLSADSIVVGPTGDVRLIDIGMPPIVSRATARAARREGNSRMTTLPSREGGPAGDVRQLGMLVCQLLGTPVPQGHSGATVTANGDERGVSASDRGSPPGPGAPWAAALDPNPEARPSAALLASMLQRAAIDEARLPKRAEESTAGNGEGLGRPGRLEYGDNHEPGGLPQRTPPSQAHDFERKVEVRGQPGDLRRRRPVGLTLLLGLLIGVLIVAAAVLWQLTRSEDLHRPTQPPEGEPSIADNGIVVPDVTGLSAAEANDRLLASNLELTRLVPAQGRPGMVIASAPAAGTTVLPTTPITLYVGVEPERLKEELDGPP
jgi:eukaryotic-like serine/threonine-protein kinase